MGIVTAFKNTSITTLAIKAVGIAGLGAVAWDAHSAAKSKGSMSEKYYKTESLKKSYMNHSKADSASFVKDAAKKRMLAFETDENFSGFFTHIKGYVDGFASMALNDAVPLGLSLGALITPKCWLSKAFGIGLIGYAGIFAAQEFFGVAKAR